MEINEAVRQRRSIRNYLSKDVPEDIIRDLINDSLWAPSWGNTQQYEIVAATGEALAQFKKENREAVLSGKKQSPEVPMQENWPDYLKKRYIDVGKSVLTSLAIARDDNVGRLNYYADMFSLFNAPALLIMTADREINLEYAMLDIGLYLQTFKLLAHGRGLGTISLAAAVRFPEIVRKIFKIPESRIIIIGTALGWPDNNAPVNNFERKRDTIDSLVKWVS